MRLSWKVFASSRLSPVFCGYRSLIGGQATQRHFERASLGVARYLYSLRPEPGTCTDKRRDGCPSALGIFAFRYYPMTLV
jgi:hypothetical protein